MFGTKPLSKCVEEFIDYPTTAYEDDYWENREDLLKRIKKMEEENKEALRLMAVAKNMQDEANQIRAYFDELLNYVNDRIKLLNQAQSHINMGRVRELEKLQTKIKELRH